MYPQLANPVANRGNVAGITEAETIDPGQHLRPGSNVSQIPEPDREFIRSLDRRFCSVYATEPTIKRTDEFSIWLRDLRDIRARAKVLARIDRLSLGNPGDVAPVGDGISELRIHYGPGYRVYYVQRGEEIVVLLCGGDKSSQASDIRAAKKLARELEG
jgi:putative addiction module killer protein